MRKAQERVLEMTLKGKGEVSTLLEELEKEFSWGGEFIPHKHTSSYVEIPAHKRHERASTYQMRGYKGLELVTFGNTIYLVRNGMLDELLKKPARFIPLGGTGKDVIKIEDCYYYLSDEGRDLQQEVVKNWEKLTQPLFAVNIATGGHW